MSEIVVNEEDKVNEDNQVNTITLECLMNPILYRRYVENNNITENEVEWGKERYKDKITEITRTMLEGKIEIPQLEGPFNDYIKEVVEYFKFVEKIEIYNSEVTSQTESACNASGNASGNTLINEDDTNTGNNYNRIIMNRREPYTGMRKFVTIKHTQPNNDISLNYPIIKKERKDSM